ncbi:hypothetical protein HVA01_07920 [Halovibrio variabilis]|uniref:Polymer-forming cytoskeletal protein n=1 Tax=Halovibrio variabilis TaxID=31910 RepID=A0A511UKN1_9GAMM|nr:polymer-forming cytoskeletal protein [Halovibrio variabilis]GEN27146.1 hypothetical protein HVA01_07920 [Halovibrio variabilis]
MGIQVWFIVLGVGVMTLIVWDGKRRKLKQRASLMPDGSGEDIASFATSAAPVVIPPGEYRREGSRIGVATQIVGKVIADEPVLIKGLIEGTVIAPNHPITVTATGHVASYIEGSCVYIDGYVAGALRANTKATLLSRARIKGVIEAPRLECVAGAWLHADVARNASRKKIAMVS